MTKETDDDIGFCWVTVSPKPNNFDSEKNLSCWQSNDKTDFQGQISDVIMSFNETEINELQFRVTLNPQWIERKIKIILPHVECSNDFFCGPAMNFDKIEEFLESIEYNFKNFPSTKTFEGTHRNEQYKGKQIFESVNVCLNKDEVLSLFLNVMFQFEKSSSCSYYEINDIEKVEAFKKTLMLLKDSSYSDIVDIDENIWNYIQKHNEECLTKLLENVSFNVINGNQLQISSCQGKEKVDEALDLITKLYLSYTERITTKSFCLNEAEEFNILKSFLDGKDISGKCCYKVCGPKSDLNELEMRLNTKQKDCKNKRSYNREGNNASENDVKDLHVFDSGLKILICKGNLIHQRTEAIVNPANPQLAHGGGAAKVISNAAGVKLEEECKEYVRGNGPLPVSEVMHTTAGNLRPNIKHVMHTVGPKCQTHEDLRNIQEISSLMFKTFLNCFKYANDELKISTVAVPAISSGIFGVPINIVGSAMFRAVKVFEEDRKSNVLKEIHFVNNDEKTVNNILKAFSDWKEGKCGPKGNKRHDEGNNITDLTNEANKPHKISTIKSGDDNDYNLSGSHSEERKKVYSSDYRSFGANDDNGKAMNKLADQNDKTAVSCVICMDEIIKPETLKCGHVFCKDCLVTYNKKCSQKCPTCGMIYGEMKGNQPPGTMTVKKHSSSLPGFDDHGTIEILYHFQDGVQNETHPNPGQLFHGTHRAAFLPDNGEGRGVLKMFRKAFDNKLLFTIGRSMTLARENSIVWNDIHQKTQKCGEYGYPDPGYFKRVKQELAAKGIYPDDCGNK